MWICTKYTMFFIRISEINSLYISEYLIFISKPRISGIRTKQGLGRVVSNDVPTCIVMYIGNRVPSWHINDCFVRLVASFTYIYTTQGV